MDILFQAGAVVLIGLIGHALWRSGRPRPFFTIRLVRGEPRVVAGKVTPVVLALIRDVTSFHRLRKGWISGVPGPLGIRLEFSRSIPEAARQQIRNGWGALGWKPGPKRPRKR